MFFVFSDFCVFDLFSKASRQLYEFPLMCRDPSAELLVFLMRICLVVHVKLVVIVTRYAVWFPTMPFGFPHTKHNLFLILRFFSAYESLLLFD